MRIEFFCGSPNFRGIHQYCLYLDRLAKPLYSVGIRQPYSSYPKRSLLLRFISQFFWELFPGPNRRDVNLEIFASPRLPVRNIIFQGKRQLSGAVVLDFIQCIDDWSLLSLLSLHNAHGFIELIKRVIHTIYFLLSLDRVDFIVFISQHASSGLQAYNPVQYKRLSAHSLILHPSPSFSPRLIEDVLFSLPLENDPTALAIHVVTGNAPSKQPQVLEQCLKKLKVSAKNNGLRIICNVFGYDSVMLKNLTDNNFAITSYAGFVDERFLVQSCLLSHVFLSTSRAEGFGIPLLDSLLFGLRCVCTPIEPFREISNTYASFSSPVQFSSSSDASAADELADLLLENADKISSINPIQRATNYINLSAQIGLSAKERLNKFLLDQLSAAGK